MPTAAKETIRFSRVHSVNVKDGALVRRSDMALFRVNVQHTADADENILADLLFHELTLEEVEAEDAEHLVQVPVLKSGTVLTVSFHAQIPFGDGTNDTWTAITEVSVTIN